MLAIAHIEIISSGPSIEDAKMVMELINKLEELGVKCTVVTLSASNASSIRAHEERIKPILLR